MKKITILHVFPDEKFFDGISNFYDQIPEVENRYVYYTSRKNFTFKYIKNAGKIKIVKSFMNYMSELRNSDVDVAYFHSLGGMTYFYMLLLPKRVKTIWWEWGFDIYHSLGNGMVPPLVKIERFKPLTKLIVSEKESSILSLLKKIFVKPFYSFLQKKAISRVDYMRPCLPAEYELMQRDCPFFRAKLYPYEGFVPQVSFHCHYEAGNIIIGNSLTYSNNHLDIFETISNCQIDNIRQIYIPVSYGGDYNGCEGLIRRAEKMRSYNVKWLAELMLSKDYFSMMESVTHAIFGIIRQQALGNIYYCLYNGIKLYLYDESVVAQQLRKEGFIIFSIDNELNTESLSKCLTEEDAKHNYDLYIRRYEGHGVLDIRKQLDDMI